MSTQEKALKEIIAYRDRLEEIEYEDIKTLIKESIRHIPIALAKLHKNAMIDRVRLNNGKPFFTSENELSYITDEEVINTHLTEFGRANKPHQPLFYGALMSEKIRENRMTAYAETSTLLRDTESVNLEGELFTLSRWKTNQELIVPEIVFSEEAITANPQIEASFRKYYNDLMIEPMRELALRQLQLFSQEFARKIRSHHDYKIAVAYADLLMTEGDYPGILYPSVQTGYQGQNLVLRPDIVDKHLVLTSVSTHRVHKNKLNSTMANYYHTQNFGENNSNFVWDLGECDEDYLIKKWSNQVEKEN
ncbi:RES domain-containing protein [Myroides sp. M-43]|uniref:RES domain-containing protein n=1 Tax=Myroides oncorhynchi TaxID=2893756 RepID=UPI001E62DEEF|nr:RES domain-containing protein [Myroides oncorhynchi]MCC9042710.1 RES domain-containing protein [Myroides oncorhynchi]